MLTSKQIFTRAVVDVVLVDGRKVRAKIIDVRDGNVILRGMGRHYTSRWWLPYKVVKLQATFVRAESEAQQPAANKRRAE